MLDIRMIREQTEAVKQRLAGRGPIWGEQVDAVIGIDRERRAAETQLQTLQAERKRISKEIGAKKGRGEDTAAIEAEVRAMGEKMAALQAAAGGFDARQRDLLLSIPNLPHEECPAGTSAEDNPEVRAWGTKPEFAFAPKDHIALGAALGLFDFERAAKISGSAFVCFTGIGARLERALISYMLDLHGREHGYTEVSPPFVVKSEALVGTAQLPKFEEQQYRVERDGLYLAPTAEVPVTNLHAEELLAASVLPLAYVAYTPCFRREAGSAGLGTRGLIRMHQFDKVELVRIVEPEQSFAELELLTGHAEAVLRSLGLHYRIIELCAGDLGFGSAKTYDIEVWSPGQNGYLEVSSCSNFGDYQARRMNLRFKDGEGKNRFCHTLNGSGVACPRLMVALLETHQREDGTVGVPEPLRPYIGTDVLRPA